MSRCRSSLSLALVAVAFWTLCVADLSHALQVSAVSAKYVPLDSDSLILAELSQSDMYYSQDIPF